MPGGGSSLRSWAAEQTGQEKESSKNPRVAAWGRRVAEDGRKLSSAPALAQRTLWLGVLAPQRKEQRPTEI